MSIRRKVALFVSLLIMGLILAISLVTERHMENRLKEMVREHQLGTATQVAGELSELLRIRQNILLNGARAFPKDALKQPQQAQQWLNQRIVFNTLYDHFIVINAHGYAIADWPQFLQYPGENYSLRAWFKNTMRQNSSSFSTPHVGQILRKPVVIVTAPLLDASGQSIGVLAGIIDLTRPNVLGNLSKARFGETGYFQVISPDRVIVADPNPARILQPGPQPGQIPALDRALAGEGGTGEGPGPDGKTMLFGFKRMESTGWLLVAAFSEEEALAPVTELRLFYWPGTLLFMLIGASLASLLVGTLLRPLSELRRSMNSLRLDDVPVLPRLPEHGSGELDSIARSFNLMADTIRQRNMDLLENEQKLRDITASLGFGVYVLDVEGRLIFLNPAAEAMLGWNEQEVLGQDAHVLFHHHKLDGAPYPAAECPIHQSIERGTAIHLEQDWLIRRDGTPFSVEIFSTPLNRDGKPAGAVAAFQDVSSRLWAESRIQRQATLDGLTGLVNRRLFMDRLNQAIFLARRHQQSLVLLMLDLDGFKPVNDTYGHAGGDQLLQQVARRLTMLVRQSDTVARLGGDEFAVLLLDSDAASGQTVGQKILDTVAQPFKVADTECRIGVSIGMAVYPADAAQADTLLIAADGALYASKAAGKHCLQRAESYSAAADNAEQLSRRPLIEWIDDYLVGIDIIDRQHFELTQSINAIEDALINGVPRRAIEEYCDKLQQQVKRHFATEDVLMDAYRLTDMGAHKVAHHALLAGIADFKAELLGEMPYLALPQMRDWLLDHILHEDVTLAEILKKHGYGSTATGSHALD